MLLGHLSSIPKVLLLDGIWTGISNVTSTLRLLQSWKWGLDSKKAVGNLNPYPALNWTGRHCLTELSRSLWDIAIGLAQPSSALQRYGKLLENCYHQLPMFFSPDVSKTCHYVTEPSAFQRSWYVTQRSWRLATADPTKRGEVAEIRLLNLTSF